MLKKCAKLLTFGSERDNESTVIIMHNSCFETSTHVHLLLVQMDVLHTGKPCVQKKGAKLVL